MTRSSHVTSFLQITSVYVIYSLGYFQGDIFWFLCLCDAEWFPDFVFCVLFTVPEEVCGMEHHVLLLHVPR